MVRLTMAVAMLIGIVPLAQAMTCNERMAELSKKMETVVDAKTKQEAGKHMQMAKDAMAKNDESGCMSHAESGLNMMHGD
jgi:hypothetical protein